MWRSVTASKSPQSLTWKNIASGLYPVSDLYIVFICDVYLMRIKLHCTVTAQVALCQLCQLGSDYASHLQRTSDPQWSLSLCKRAMGGEDQSFDCQLKPANNSLTCCYSISHNHNHGSGKWWFFKGKYFWRDPFYTSMIVGGRVFQKNVAKKPWSRFISLCDDLAISYMGAFFWR